LFGPGDYKNPPPQNEHAGLRRYYQTRSGKPVELDLEVRVEVCREFVGKMLKLGFRTIACSAGERHVHALAELPSEYRQRRKVVGQCKQKASHAVHAMLPGSIWSEGGEFKRIRDAGHLRNTYNYIRTRQEAGTIVWSHRADEDWIHDESRGIVLMTRNKTQTRQTRVFGVPQTPASNDSNAGTACDP